MPAVKLLPWWAVPVIWRFTAYFGNTAYRQSRYRRKTKNAHRQNMTAVLHHRRKNTAIFCFYRFHQKIPPILDTAKKYRQLSIPPKEYRQFSIPPKRYRQHWMTPKRYRQHWMPPKRYHRYWIPPKRYRLHWRSPKKVPAFFFVFLFCSLFFLVLRVVLTRTSLWTCGQKDAPVPAHTPTPTPSRLHS